MDHTVALSYLKQSDPILAPLMEQLGPCSLGRHQTEDDLFLSLARSIIYQRISIKAANTIYARFLNLFPQTLPAPQALLELPDVTLRGIGLPTAKVLYLKDLADKVLQGLPTMAELTTMEDEAIIQTLTPIKGIGRWSVEMLLMFQLKRLDVLPVDDLGIRAAMRDLYRLAGLPNKATMVAIARQWQPYRTIACWYLWQSRDVAARELLNAWG